MEISKLDDLRSLRTAPQLSLIQTKKLSEELEINIFNADWLTIGIMAPSDIDAIDALKSISKKYSSIKFLDLESWLFKSFSNSLEAGEFIFLNISINNL